jgi:hypothetical protein
LIHPGVCKLRLLPWTAQSGATRFRRTIQQRYVYRPRRRSCCCSDNETGPGLPIQDRKADAFGKSAEVHKPFGGR